MFPMEKAIWNLLKDNIYYNDELVIPLIRRLTPEDETPCITIEQAAETQLKRQVFHSPNEIIRLTNNAEVWINIWCDTEEQRNTLIKQVETRIFQALSNHYSTCKHYSNEKCNNLNKTCEALIITNGRTAKKQCPYPIKNNYINWFKEHKIIKSTFNITGRSNMDELNLAQPVLRTLIQLDMNYYSNYNAGGHVLNNINLDEELL